MGQVKSRFISSLCGHGEARKSGGDKKKKNKSPCSPEPEPLLERTTTPNAPTATTNVSYTAAAAAEAENVHETEVVINEEGKSRVVLIEENDGEEKRSALNEQETEGAWEEGRTGKEIASRTSSGNGVARPVQIRQVTRSACGDDDDPGIIRIKKLEEGEDRRNKSESENNNNNNNNNDNRGSTKFSKTHSLKHRVRFDMAKKQGNLADPASQSPAGTSSAPHSNTPQRRGSFLYRSNSDFEISPQTISRNSSVASDQHPEDVIITPFAQILNSLHNVHDNFKALADYYNNKLTESTKQKNESSRSPPTPTKITTTSTTNITTPSSQTPSPTTPKDLPEASTEDKDAAAAAADDDPPDDVINTDASYTKLASETLVQLDWCLEQLEKVQTDKAVTEMARNKFKKLLSNEMTKCAESSKSGVQISEYICRTFLDQEVEMSSIKQARCVTVQLSTHQHPLDNNNNNQQQQQQQQQPQQHVYNTKVSSKLFLHTQLKSNEHGITSIDEEDDAINSDDVTDPRIQETQVRTKQQKNEINAILDEVDTWGIDIFRLASLSNFKPLTTVTMHIVKKRNLFTKLRIPEKDFLAYMLMIESHYRPEVPYHNSTHAADVTQSSHYLLTIPTLKAVFTDLEIFSTIFASAVHDTDHPGLTNQFLINTGSEFALLYNDESVLENHHVSVAFKLLKETQYSILTSFSNKSRQLFRKMVISIVLATDMNKHMDHLAHLKTMAETKSISGESDLRLNNYAERNQVLQSLIHCSDLSNPTKHLSLYRRWNDLISQEFYKQGDLERERGLELSPMCDRTTATVEKTQVGFIDYIVHPLWEAWADLMHPHCQHILDSLEDNREWYNNIICSSPSINPS